MNKYLAIQVENRMDMLAAVIEGWVTVRLGRGSIVVLATVLGRLCGTYRVDPSAATRVVYLSHEASRPTTTDLRS